MNSNEIRNLTLPHGSIERELLRECAYQLAIANERTPAPGAASAFVSEVRPNPGNEKEASCEICGATLVCLSCGNHRFDPAPGTTREQAIAEVEAEIDLLRKVWPAYYPSDSATMERIVDVEQARLAELKRGLREVPRG